MTNPIKSPRKLIEVALPLDAINAACAKEKSIRHGHPSTLHLWWARRPLAAARAVIFAQMVNDPGYQQGGGFKYGKNKREAAVERKRLFKIIEDLVRWENTNNEEVLELARAEIRRSWREVCDLNRDHPQAAALLNPEVLPGFHDPFAGGGSIPLEAQRLGLDANASDLNPVAVLINKAMIEFPPKFAGNPPVNTDAFKEKDLRHWKGAQGLAEDVRFYARRMRNDAENRIGNLYPPVKLTAEMARGRSNLQPIVGKSLTVIAWLWARTVKSPNPAFSHVHVPLASTFILSTKEGRQAYVQPVVEGESYHFTLKLGPPPAAAGTGTKANGRGANFRCLVSDVPISPEYIRSEGQAGRMGATLLAAVADGPGGRVYLPPTPEMRVAASKAEPSWKPELEFFQQGLGFRIGNYGLTSWGDVFTARQLVALTTFCDLVADARNSAQADALRAGMSDDGLSLDSGGAGATAYADAIAIYLAFAVSKAADRNSSLCVWESAMDRMRGTFGRQALPMVWDFVETNPFAGAGGDIFGTASSLCEVLDQLHNNRGGRAQQANAAQQTISRGKVISTDPPYYDNIGYADLSDFFYVWLRRALKEITPSLFATLAVPKADELVATPARHGGKDKAEAFFLSGMTEAMRRIAEQGHPAFPVSIYYAFKQSETRDDEGTASTGWETFLEALNRAGLQLTGTWPMRTELGNRMRNADSNALASSIVLVCRKRPAEAPSIARREFLRELNGLLPDALDEMTRGSGDELPHVAPVDLSQAIMGPGMAVFSKYSAVLEADGSSMKVRTALQLINRFLAEDDFDPDTQFCLHWFEQHGWSAGPFGDAETLSRAKGTSVDGVRGSGVVESGSGSVRLRKWSEYAADWDPGADTRNPVWETLHQLIRALRMEGETAAGQLLFLVRGKAESARQLAYRLYTLCERQGWADDARAYNELITSWASIEAAASAVPAEKQSDLFP